MAYPIQVLLELLKLPPYGEHGRKKLYSRGELCVMCAEANLAGDTNVSRSEANRLTLEREAQREAQLAAEKAADKARKVPHPSGHYLPVRPLLKVAATK